MAADTVEIEASIENIFHSWDLNSNGFIEKSELASCCSELHLTEEQLNEVFTKLDNDSDGKISLNDFNCGFKTVCSLFQVDSDEVVHGANRHYKKFEKLLDAIGVRNLLTGQEYVSELFHYLHSSSDSPQLLALLESFLFSVVRDVKHFSEENHRLEDALKRTCEKHAEHMENLDDEMEQQMSRLESRVRKEEKSKSERQNLDVVWQLESKNKELQSLNTKLQKLETKIKKKEPEEHKLKEECEEKVQELRYMKSQLTDAQTNLAILRSELVQLRSKEEDQTEQLQREKATVLDCVQEQESLTRQLHLLHEANKKLHDTNDDLRSALELKKSTARNSPLPTKRHSISVLSSSRPSKRSSRASSRRGSAYQVTEEFNGEDREDPQMSASGPPCFDVTSTPLADRRSSRRDSLLPTQQTCEVDNDNESSLLNELMEATQASTFDFGADDEDEMDEAYSTMPSNERDAFQQQLKILQESNSDLRLALKALSKKGRVSKPKSRKSDEYRQQPSVHSDYGSISSRSITPNHLQGPKSDEDAGDGVDAEELSGYEPEDSTITVEDFQFVCAPVLTKNTATSRDRIDYAVEESNDVVWEDESDTDTLVQQPLSRTSSVETNGPIGSSFDRNASGRKPCRYKSLEQIMGDSNNGKNKPSLPLIVREGKWQSLEQIRKRQEFSGERSKSLPTSRWQSGEKLDFNRGIGLVELSEKLDALRKSQEDIDINGDLHMLGCSETDQVVDSYILNNYRNELDFDSNELVKALSPSKKPVPFPRQRKIKDCEQETTRFAPDETDKQSGKVFKPKQSESLPESEHSTRQDDLSTELEAQFKSVMEEDEDDLDEYDVGDEELAKLVAMTSADTDETDSDPDTETELPEERGAAVGADSLSEASSNTLNTSTREQTTPERMYKIVLAGDAAVGKSSFILRLCRNRFHSALNSTLGVDFQMKTMEVDGKTIALQLWDTAGQERFRSIAKSYFRKADGVLLLYDVTCETSFLNVREWVDAIEDSSSKSIPIMLCGNKTDLRPEYTAERKTVISAECGQKLAKEYGALFSETSAKDGSNIQHACIELARILRTIEDQDMESIGMKLTETDPKSKKRMGNCCKT